MASGRQIIRFEPTGIRPDEPPSVASDDVYTIVSDVVFRGGGAQRVKGEDSVYPDPVYPPLWSVFSRDASDLPVWLYGGAAGIGYYTGAAHVDITPTDFVPASGFNPYTGGILNSLPVMSARRPYWWDGAGVMQRIPDWPDTRFCGAMRPYKFHLIAMAIDEAGALFEDSILWSAAAPPGQIPQLWTAAPDNEAGGAELSQTGGQVRDGLALRSSFIIYKDTSTYIMDYVGGSTVMSVRLLFSRTGILAANCVAEFRGLHYVLTDGDCVAHDGQTVVSIAEDWVRNIIFETSSGSNLRNAFVVANANESEIWFCVPREGATYPDVAYVYNVTERHWGIRELPYFPASIAPGQVRLVDAETSWDADPQAWDDDPSPWNASAGRVDFYQLLESCPANPAGDFQAVDQGVTRNGDPVTATIEKQMMSFGDTERVKTVKAVWLEILGTPGSQLNIAVAGNDDASESPIYGTPRPYVIGTTRKVNLFATGRYISLQISSNDPNPVEPWRVAAFSFEFEPRGLY